MKYTFYKKCNSEKLDNNLFINPTAEYRGMPFWAWNTNLNEKELLRQIDCFKNMGFGGFYIHARTGLDTRYLGDEFMRLVSVCNEKAKKCEMIYGIYDEDRFSSGAAGGYTTIDNPVLRKRRVIFSTSIEPVSEKVEAILKGEDYLIAKYDIKLDENGKLEDYKKATDNTVKSGYKRIYAYCMCERPSGWRNNGTDIDSMNSDAINRFLDITLSAYEKSVGKDFGKDIYTIFTDEPQTSIVMRLDSPFEESFRKSMQWTNDLPETFFNTYGYDLLDYLPELLYDLPNGEMSFARYDFYNHTTERFVYAFPDTYAKRCDEVGLLMTGHTMLEDTLSMQTSAVGECMRFYRSMQIPGIDALGDWSRKFMTSKQAQSVAHQYGREGVLSEQYGVTGWKADFKMYKSQGDWQAVSGITMRVPHLAWVSMKGDAKRDCPASIGSQSSWHSEFKIIEDHFARLNTVLTRGKPIVDIAVIHPVESIWMIFGPVNDNKERENYISEMFKKVNNGLFNHHYDYDYLCESLLPQQIRGISDKLTVGEMDYSVIIVPPCITLRLTTINILEEYVRKGGKLIFIGEKPQFADGKKSNRIDNLFSSAEHLNIEDFYNSDTIKAVSRISVRNSDGSDAENLVCCMREDNGVKWVFVTHNDGEYKYDKKELISQKTEIIISGNYYPEIFDTVTGEIKPANFEIKNGKTTVFSKLYDNDSLLIKYSAGNDVKYNFEDEEFVCERELILPPLADFELDEDNVLVLDRAEYKIENGEWCDSEILVPLDRRLRKENKYDIALEPWACKDVTVKEVKLRFKVYSEIDTYARICYESGYDATLNGETIDMTEDGWYVDFDIKKSSKFLLKSGENVITVKVPFSQKHHIENMYLIGDFGVRVLGGVAKIVSREPKIGFSSITYQGMPFYGGAVKYKSTVITGNCDMRITCRDFNGALARVYVDGKDAGYIAFSPYSLTVRNVSAGKHTIEFKVYCNRENTFGRLYNRYPSGFYSTEEWYPDKFGLSREYCLENMGILHAPKIEIGKIRALTDN